MGVYVNKREEIQRVAELGGTSDIRIVSDTIGLMKETGGTVTVLQGTTPWEITPSGGTLNITLGSGTNIIGTVDARQSGSWTVITDATSTVQAIQSGTWSFTLQSGTNVIGTIDARQSGTWNVNQNISYAGYGIITDGTSTVGVTADGRLRTDAVLNVSQTSTYVWSSTNVLSNGTSAAIDLSEYTNIMAFGSASSPTTFTVLISPDNSAYFNDTTVRTTGSNDNFAFDIERSGFWYKVQSSATGTLTFGFMAKT